jgi:hypothetical protein
MNRIFFGRIGQIGQVKGASAPIASAILPILFITDSFMFPQAAKY